MANPLGEIDANKASSQTLDYLYADTRGITYAKHPSNLVEPLKVNENFEFKSEYDPWKLKSMAFGSSHNPSAALGEEIRKMNPTMFDPNTPQQRDQAFVKDLIYHPENDNVSSMHNALVNPGTFVPPPKVVDQDPYFNPEMGAN